MLEPWNTLLFVVAVPVVVQILKLIAAKAGKPLPSLAVQIVAAGLSIGFVYLSGGFAGIELPAYAGDPVFYVGSLLAFALAAWGPIELVYSKVLKAVFEKIGL